MSPDEYREKREKLLSTLKDPVIAFIESRCYEDHHSYGYEAVLNEIPVLRQEVIELFQELGLDYLIWK